MISWKIAEKIGSQPDEQRRLSPEGDLLLGLLELAIDDLHHPHPVVRKLAKWWIYEDDSREVDFKTGYVSFYAACHGVGVNPEWVRKKLEVSAGRLPVIHKELYLSPLVLEAKRAQKIHTHHGSLANFKRRMAS